MKILYQAASSVTEGTRVIYNSDSGKIYGLLEIKKNRVIPKTQDAYIDIPVSINEVADAVAKGAYVRESYVCEGWRRSETLSVYAVTDKSPVVVRLKAPGPTSYPCVIRYYAVNSYEEPGTLLSEITMELDPDFTLPVPISSNQLPKTGLYLVRVYNEDYGKATLKVEYTLTEERVAVVNPLGELTDPQKLVESLKSTGVLDTKTKKYGAISEDVATSLASELENAIKSGESIDSEKLKKLLDKNIDEQSS